MPDVLMTDLAFVTGTLALMSLLGYPLARLFPPGEVHGRWSAAPVLGYGLFGPVVTIFYRSGHSPQRSLHLVVGVVLCALVVGTLGAELIRRRGSPPVPASRRANRSAMVCGIAAGVVVLLCLLPKWVGGMQFAAFQGNHWDHINYIAYSSAFRTHSYADIRALTPTTARDNDYLLFAQSQLDTRPTVGLAFVTLAILFGMTTPDASYAYMAFMQALMFFAAAFALLNLFRARAGVAAIVAAALTVGFFMQYVFDINAWSQLAAMPLVILALAVLILMTDPPPAPAPTGRRFSELLDHARYTAVLALLLTAVFYFYPEIILEYGGPLALIPLWALASSRLSRPALAALTGGVVAAGLALAACLPFWSGTIGHLIRQLSLASDNSVAWWRYFQRYLFGRDIEVTTLMEGFRWSSAAIYTFLSLPVDFTVSAIGLYFVLPTSAISLPIRVVWKLVLLVLATALLVGAARSLWTAWRTDRGSRISCLFVAAIAACLLPVLFLAMGRYWSAGKALAMAAPLLFMILASPVLTGAPRPWSVVAWLFVCGHLVFGLYRPLAAADPDGIHYRFPPYPSIQDARFKRELSWDLQRWKPLLATCRRTSIDLQNPFLERYVQVYLTELGARWSSVRPLDSYYGVGTPLGVQAQLVAPDCLVTDRVHHVQPWQTVIWLSRDRRPWDFHRGADPDFEIGTLPGPSVTTSGVHGLETLAPGRDGGLRWTDGKATIEVPINPQGPPDRLHVTLWGGLRPAGGGHIQVLANGASLFDGQIPDGEWSASFPLDGLDTMQKGTRLVIQINSDVFSPPQDGRVLGVPLRHVTLVRALHPPPR